MANARMMMLYDFAADAQFRQWQVINDGVMGGVSRSTFTKADPAGAVFAGQVSLENYGGFCSVSSRQPAPVDASGFSGIALRCKGDGKTYKLTLKNDASFGGFSYQFRFAVLADEWMVVRAPFGEFSYQFRFAVLADEWMVVRAPFGEFKASFRGQQVPDAPALNPGVIQSIGLLIADKQAGPFKLAIDWIQAYRDDMSA